MVSCSIKIIYLNTYKIIFIFYLYFSLVYLDFESGCEECIFEDSDSRPTPEEFGKYLTYFLQDIPDERCSKAGHAAYAEVRNISIKYF